MLAKLEGDSPIINSTATATIDSDITVSEIEKLEGIGKPTLVPKKTLKNLDDFGYYLAQTKALNQYSFDDWYYKGAGEFINGRYDEAIISFKKALETKPDKEPAAYTYNYIGTSYVLQGMNYKALEEFDKSIKLKPDNPLPYTNKAVAYLRLNQNDDAETQINLAKKLIKEEKLEEMTKPYFNSKIELLEKQLEDARNKKE